MGRGLTPDWVPRLSDDVLLIIFGGLIVATAMALYIEAKPYLVYAFRWLRQTAVSVSRHYNQLTGVMKFGTKYGDMSVRMAYNDDTIDDTNAWLLEHDLMAPPSPEGVREILRRRMRRNENTIRFLARFRSWRRRN